MPLRRAELEQLDRDDRARLLGRLTIAMIVMAMRSSTTARVSRNERSAEGR